MVHCSRTEKLSQISRLNFSSDSFHQKLIQRLSDVLNFLHAGRALREPYKVFVMCFRIIYYFVQIAATELQTVRSTVYDLFVSAGKRF